MDLKGTKTERNLLLAYTGESNNRNLYTYFADRAQEEGFEQIAAIFRETAEHEREHAAQELRFIQTRDIELPAIVYPVKGVGATLSNLETAVSGEHYEQVTMYPGFANSADEEGFSEIARMFRYIATVEAYHEKRFIALLNRVKDGSVFRRTMVVNWKCRLCGYRREDREAPQCCPICGRSRAFFELPAENDWDS
jgi:rubrerythrin